MRNQVIILPAQGGQTIQINAGAVIEFGFDPANATFSREGGDLVIVLENGDEHRLEGFFALGGSEALPEFRLAGGEVIEGGLFLQSVDPEFDVTPAMGPAAPQSGGLGAYESGAGELIAGIESLGMAAAANFYDPSGGTASTSASMAVSPGSGVSFPQTPDTGEGGDPGAGPDPLPESGGEEIPLPQPDGDGPHAYVRAALLGADGSDSPSVTMFLLDADGNRLAAPYPAGIEVKGGEGYAVSYDSDSGTVTITLKNPAAGAVPAENIVITAGGASYVVQAGSSSGNDLAGVEWTAAGEGVEFADRTWAGSASDHLGGNGYFVPGHNTGANIVTPEGYAGTELHLQLTDSSLTAIDRESPAGEGAPESDGGESSSVELNLGGGSFSISNEGQAVFEVEHLNPMDPERFWASGDYDTSAPDYHASVVAAIGAKGQNADNTVTVNGGDAYINAGNTALDANDAGAVNVGGVYAAEGGSNTVNAENVNVSASSNGFSGNGSEDRHATVGAVRSDGAIMGEVERESDWGAWTEEGVIKASETNLNAVGNVNVETAISGDASRDHSGVSYGGVVATERGRVNVSAGGEVNIGVENHSEGALSTSGIYGVYSGYGFGSRDLLTLEDFKIEDGAENWGDRNGDGYDEEAYSSYMYSVLDQYHRDKRGDWDEETASYLEKGEQTKVDIDAGGDVNVNVNLGGQDYHGRASGVSAVMGDVNVRSGGDLNVSLSHRGNHGGSADQQLSALELGFGRIHMQAEGDVNLRLEGNGENLSVVNYLPGGSYYSLNYGLNPNHLSGTNVTLEGAAGGNGGLNNSIIGLDATESSFKKEAFTVHADESFTIDVSAQHNGGDTSATGIGSSRSGVYGGYHENYLGLMTNAPEFEIRASVTGDINAGTSSAAGIAIGGGGSLGIASYDSLSQFQNSGYHIYEGSIVKAVESLKVTAEGARHNTGISVSAKGGEWQNRSGLEVRAHEMEINAFGGAAAGDSSSYGIRVSAIGNDDGYSSAKANIQAEELTINVSNPQHSVGISAEGQGSQVGVSSLGYYDEEGNAGNTGLRVVINCTIENAGHQLNGIAIEALNGGYVTIQSHDWNSQDRAHNDSIVINGDIRAETLSGGYESRIMFETGLGDDRVELNGDITLGKQGVFDVFLGEGDDYLSLGGGITLGEGARMSVYAGEGDDVIRLGGKVDLGFHVEEGNLYSRGELYMDAGAGNDLLILEAPDAATFNEWYKDWLQTGSTFDQLNVENVVVQGVNDLDALSWLNDLVNANGGVNLQLRGDESSFSVINNYAALVDGFELDGSGGNDTLYLRYSGGDSLEMLGGALAEGQIGGLEHLVLDLSGTGFADSANSANSVDELFSPDLLSDLFEHGGGANIMLKVDSLDDLNLSGWSNTGTIESINGTDYQVYSNAELEQQVFLEVLGRV